MKNIYNINDQYTRLSVLYFFLCLLLTGTLQSQNSHQSIIDTTDADKARLFGNIAEDKTSIDSIFYYADKAITFGKKAQDDIAVAKGLISKGKAYRLKNKKDSALFYTKSGLSLVSEKFEIQSYGYYTLGCIFHQNSAMDSAAYYYQKTTDYEDNHPLYAARSYSSLGQIYDWQSKSKEAETAAKKAIQLFNDIGNDGYELSYAYLSLAEVYQGRKEYDKGISSLEKALTLVEEGSIPQANIFSQIAFTYTMNKQYELALDYSKKVLDIYLKKNGSLTNITSALYRIATIYHELEMYDKELEYLQRAEPYANTLNNLSWTSLIFVQKGMNFKKTQRYDSAVFYLKKGISIRRQTNNKSLLSHSLYELGDLYNTLQEPKKAEAQFLSAIDLAIKSNFVDVKQSSFKNISSTYEALGNYEESLNYYKKYRFITDSLSAIDTKIAIDELQVKYETAEKEKNINVLKKENEQTKQFYTILTIAITFVLIMLFMIFYFIRKKKNLQLVLELKKEKEVAQVKNMFLENLSHEIRTPVSVINGYLRLIQRNSLYPSRIVRFSDLATRNSNIIINNLNSFLTLHKLDQDSLKGTSKSNAIGSYIRDLVQSFEGNAQLKNIGLYYKTNINSSLFLNYDYEKLTKIINNLLSNAIKYTPPNKCIYVDIIFSKSSFKIIVKDEGVGISKDELELIFNRFYQSEKHKISGGFGIGLSLAKGLIKNLEGTIDLQSKEKVGSVFTIELPITVEDIQLYIDPKQDEYECFSCEKETYYEPENNFPKTLIVDDNIEMTSYLKELLSPFLNCWFAYNGEHAIAQIKDQDFDLIISDLRMPVMDGLQLKKALNAIERYQNIPFILLTASAPENLNDLGLSLGINDYITKPFEESEIVTRIRKLLENKLYQKKIQENHSSIEFEGHLSELLDKVHKIVLDNLSSSEFSVSELATQCGYSQKQLSRILQAKTGLTLVKIVLEIRLLKSYEFIINKTYSTLNEVIYAIGLNSRSYFNKKFLERFGVKPQELINGKKQIESA